MVTASTCCAYLQARRTIDHAFRRQVSKVAANGPAGSSPQPQPPLDGSSSLQPPTLGLGPPATALGVAGNSNVPAHSSNSSSSTAAGNNGQRSSFASFSNRNKSWQLPNGLQGLPHGSNSAGPGSLGGSPTEGLSPSAEFPGNSRSAFAAAQAAGFGQSGSRRLDLTLLANAEAIYGPLLLEQRNVLLAGGKVVGLLDDVAAEALRGAVQGLAVLDCSGCLIVPGFVDCHVHITGGGGEAGPASRWVANEQIGCLPCCN
jgi:hypothetical protein